MKTFEEFQSPSHYDAQYDRSSKYTNEDLVDMLSVIAPFPNSNLIPFKLDEWDSIVNEIRPAVERMKDLGYTCETFIKPHNIIEIQVTT